MRWFACTISRISVDWRTIPFYVVGDATAAAASQIHTAFPTVVHLAPAENGVRGGAEAGTAERLAAFILEEGCEGRRMLYLTGDKNRETLPEMLTAGGVGLETLEVYGTTGSSTFRDNLGAALERAPVGESHIMRATRTSDRSRWQTVAGSCTLRRLRPRLSRRCCARCFAPTRSAWP